MITSGIPIYKYKNVKKWFDKLNNDNNFSKEIKIDLPLLITSKILKIINKLKRKYVTDLVDFN